jgi:hypothetical protein
MAGVVPQRKLFARRLLHFFEVGNEKLLSAVATVSRQKRFLQGYFTTHNISFSFIIFLRCFLDNDASSMNDQ